MSVNYIDENGNMTNIAPLQDSYTKAETDTLLDGKADSSTTSLVQDIDAYRNIADDGIVGVEVDMEAKTVTRIAGAVGKSAGTDFNSINAFGGRKRCNLADDGTVNAYHGDSGYAEDGSNGQVMVEQPKFYYKVVPLKVDKASKGWILRKARYYVSDKPREGFKIHPEFKRSGKIKEKVYQSAFEGSLYDVSASAYITDDAQVADFSADKLSSIANAKPISGLTQNLTRANIRKLAENRGLGWEQLTVQVASATQLLMLIEYATFNMQSALSAGNSKTDDGSSNLSENTGATSSLGNASGEVINANGIKMFSYRGEENFYANIWKWMDGLNKYDQTVYIADHNFVDGTEDGYTDAGITACNASGYIKAFCYSEDYDWLFIPAEVNGGADSALPVGDYYWYAAGWRIAGLGGAWGSGAGGGAFCLALYNASSYRDRAVGGRLCYIPDTDESSDRALTNEELTTDTTELLHGVSAGLDNAATHNAIYRGKNVTKYFTDGTLFTRISSGAFDDLYIGDYFYATINGTSIVCRIAGFNLMWNNGDTALQKNHAVIVPDTSLMSAEMNDSNVTAGAYLNSKMRTETLATINGWLATTFGSHLVTVRELLSKTMNDTVSSMGRADWTGASTDWGWYDSKADLMTEVEVYGSTMFSSSAYDIGTGKTQYPLFALAPQFINPGRFHWWLRCVASSSYFCYVGGNGNASGYDAGASRAVRPRWLIG